MSKSNVSVALLATLATAWVAPHVVEAGTIPTNNVVAAPIVPVSNLAYVYTYSTGSSSAPGGIAYFSEAVFLNPSTAATPTTFFVSLPSGPNVTLRFFSILGTYVGVEPENVTVGLGGLPSEIAGSTYTDLFGTTVSEASLQTALQGRNAAGAAVLRQFASVNEGSFISFNSTGVDSVGGLYNFSTAMFNGNAATALIGGVTAPEPAMLGTLLIGGLATLRRRRA